MRPSLEAEWALIQSESEIRVQERLHDADDVTLGNEQYRVERRGVTQGGVPRHYRKQIQREQRCTLY